MGSRRKKQVIKRSGLEDKVSEFLEKEKLKAEYENGSLPYQIPASDRNYHWDWEFPNGIILEVKGKLDRDTRRKMLLVKAHNPDEDIRFLMHRNNLLVKGGKRRYSDWARINKFPCCFMEPGKTVEQEPWTTIIKEWYEEDCK